MYKIKIDIINIFNTISIMRFILIDGSYFVFYRYHALKKWWSYAGKSAGGAVECSPNSEEFMDKFRKIFVSSIQSLPKTVGISKKENNKDPPIIMVGKDCPRADIWRTKLHPTYKDGRANDSEIGAAFSIVYKEDLFTKGGSKAMLYDPSLEADDCIAITSKYIVDTYPDAEVWIITSDMDYLQVASDRIRLFTANGKDLTNKKDAWNDPKKDLFCKIVSGDKSDNISGIFPRCGMKTAGKYYDDPELFQKKLNETPGSDELYRFNKTMIDFNNIPQEYVERFRKECLKLNM